MQPRTDCRLKNPGEEKKGGGVSAPGHERDALRARARGRAHGRRGRGLVGRAAAQGQARRRPPPPRARAAAAAELVGILALRVVRVVGRIRVGIQVAGRVIRVAAGLAVLRARPGLLRWPAGTADMSSVGITPPSPPGPAAEQARARAPFIGLAVHEARDDGLRLIPTLPYHDLDLT